MTDTDQKTWEGWWRFPTEPEPELPPHGTLSYDTELGARLRLVLPGPLDPFPAPQQRRDAIHGVTVQGREVSLLDARLQGAEGTLMAGRIEHWLGEVVVDGEHVDSLADFRFDDITVQVLGLSEWMSGWWRGPPGFVPVPRLIPPRRSRNKTLDPVEEARERRHNRVNRGRLSNYERMTRRYERDFTLAVDDGISLSTRTSLRRERTDRGYRDVHHTDLRVVARTPLTLEQVTERALEPMVQFLVLALGDQARVEHITVNRKQPIEPLLRPAVRPGMTHLPREVEVYQQPYPRLRRGKPNYQRELLLPRAALGPRVEKVLAAWWQLLAELVPAQTMMFGVWNAHSIYLENMLLNLTSFAEGYHERRFDEPKLDPDEHKKLVKQLLNGLPGDVRAAYRAPLKYAYRQNQRDRMRWLVERACGWVPAITDDPTTLTDQLIDTRNHLTHLGEKSPNVVDDHALADAVERLSATLRVNLLMDLDMEPDALEYGFLSRYGRRPLFSGE